jgi:hypothetical protein
MNNLLALLMLFFCSFQVFSQDVAVKWGKEHQIPKKTYLKKIIGEDQNGIFLLRTLSETRNKTGELILERYAADGISLIYSNKLSVAKVNGENVRFEQIFYLHGQLVLFTSYYDKTEGYNAIYVQYLDETGKGISEVRMINTINAHQKRNIGKFEIALSQDSSKILICSNEPFVKYANEKIHYQVIDSKNLNPLWSNAFELPYNGRELHISNHIVDHQGNVHMLAKVTRKIEKDRSQANYFFTIISYIWQEDAVKEYEVSLKDKSVSDIAFKLSPAGDLIAAGFYSNTTHGQSNANSTSFGFNSMALQEQKSLVAGTFFLKIEYGSHKVVSRGIKQFDKNFLKEFMSEKNVDRGRELYSYLIDHLIIREDGGAILVGEQYFSRMVCNYDPRTGIRSCNYHYYYNDIVVVNINPDGSIRWTKKIPKLQHSINDGGFYSSYILGYDKESLFVVFNENLKNMMLKDENRMKYMNNPRKAIVALVTINQNGNMKKTPLFAAKDQKVIVRPKIFNQVSQNSAIIYGQRKKSYKLGRMNFATLPAIHAEPSSGNTEMQKSPAGN